MNIHSFIYYSLAFVVLFYNCAMTEQWKYYFNEYIVHLSKGYENSNVYKEILVLGSL